VYICLCNALTDRKLTQTATAIGSTRPVDVYAACGCRVQCGSCVRKVLNLLRNNVAEAVKPQTIERATPA
jgi:bacterioferritin-associated ferredoxin